MLSFWMSKNQRTSTVFSPGMDCNSTLVADSLSINSTLGPGLAGIIFSAILYGLTAGQCYTYFGHSPSDPRPVKFLVGILGLLDTMHIVFVTHAIYFYTITLFGSTCALSELPPVWSVSATIPVEIFLETIVRGLFCYRIWKLSGKHRIRLFVIPLIMLSSITFASGIDFMIKEVALIWFEDLQKVAWRLYITTGAGLAADLMIASLQVVLLLRCRTGFLRTDTVLRSLMLYSINTGVLTTVIAVACMILFAAVKGSFIYVAFYLALPQLLLISLLATYNARRYLREAAVADKVPMELLETPYAFRRTTRVTRIGPDNSFGKLVDKMLDVRVKTTTETKLDTNDQLVSFDSSTSRNLSLSDEAV
ncbi:hypothetical protein CERSUDRAFT_124232 [Gelatoporia subvermispora B]|uniref:DUF6534 domain-containing protein n=1 Tax=Ceriporiopsis subvermispora (strain B) TaxID=914234 RepID=M2QH17_CERS8|nr:hypothetical protein CERSUDRAFT_124232 [Gelatoporia subvermispora B]